jgi:hypothetical protein
MSAFVGTLSEIERLKLEVALYKSIAKAVSCNIRVALPGIVKSFNAEKQTVAVNLAIQESIVLNQQQQNMQIPALLDVPLVLPRAGGFTLTMPVQAGDECLVIFADMCINQWWQNAATGPDGQGNYSGQVQEKLRRHDLSDGFAILGTWSQPNVLQNYDTARPQLRNDAGTVYIAIDDTTITLDGLLALSGTPVPSSTLSDHSIPVKIGNPPVQYYIRLSTTP